MGEPKQRADPLEPTTTAGEEVAHTRQTSKEDGFNLIELLVMTIMIAVLAAIGFPMFFKQQDEANNSWVQQSLWTIQAGIQSYALDHDGNYPASVSRTTLVDLSGKPYIVYWPKNAWTLSPMTDSGGTYSEGNYHYSQPTRTAYRIIGYLSTNPINDILPWSLPKSHTRQ